jgi:hypothetical protein
MNPTLAAGMQQLAWISVAANEQSAASAREEPRG